MGATPWFTLTTTTMEVLRRFDVVFGWRCSGRGIRRRWSSRRGRCSRTERADGGLAWAARAGSWYATRMKKAPSRIRCKAKVLRPASLGRGGSWTFLILPKAASSKLPTRGMTTVEGTINDQPFRATLEPDGQKSHWLKLTKKLRESAGVSVGEVVTLEIVSVGEEPEPKLPADLRKALAGAPKAKALWSDITRVARRDWIQWITSAKRPETRARRVKNACDMLAAGKRRVCCFDRSGVYSKGLSAPEAAE